MRIYLLFGLFVGLFASAHAALQKGAVEVVTVTGSSNLVNKQEKRAPLTRGLSFQEGNRVETLEKATTDLALSNGSSISVEPNTLMEVKTFSQVASPLIVPGKYKDLSAEPSPSVVQIEVYRGKIKGEVRKLNPNTQYTIKTPVGLVRVRGTEFTVSYREGSSGHGAMDVTCQSGAVAVRPNSGDASKVVGPGQQHTVIGAPDNVTAMPPKAADINNDNIPDVVVTDKDGKATGVDVNGDGKPDKFVSSRPDGRPDGVDIDGDGKADAPIVTADGTPAVAIINPEGIPHAIVPAEQLAGKDDRTVTPLTYPPKIDPTGKPVEVVKPFTPQEFSTNIPSSIPDPAKPPAPGPGSDTNPEPEPVKPAPPAPAPPPPLPEPVEPPKTIQEVIEKPITTTSPSGG